MKKQISLDNGPEQIKDALLKKAKGYETNEIIEEFSIDENGKEILTKRKVTKKFVPPDVSALKAILECFYADEEKDYESMSDEELLKEKERLLKMLKENEENL